MCYGKFTNQHFCGLLLWERWGIIMIVLIAVGVLLIAILFYANKTPKTDKAEQDRIKREIKQADEIIQKRELIQNRPDETIQKVEKKSPYITASAPISATTSDAELPKSDSKGKRHRVAGTSYHMDEIMKFAHENPDYKLTKKQIISRKMEDTAIGKYVFDPVTVTLEPEPDNPVDKNAIKVLFNGTHIGYIKAGSCSHIHNLMKSNRIESISGRLYGGPSKMVCFYGDSSEDAELEKSDGTVCAEIRIIEKQK